MTTSTINLPSGFGENVLSQTSSLFSSFSPIVIMILGLVAFFFVAKVFVGIMERRRERIEDEESQLEKDIQTFGIKKIDAPAIAKKIISNKAQRAVALRASFERVIAGKDKIDISREKIRKGGREKIEGINKQTAEDIVVFAE